MAEKIVPLKDILGKCIYHETSRADLLVNSTIHGVCLYSLFLVFTFPSLCSSLNPLHPLLTLSSVIHSSPLPSGLILCLLKVRLNFEYLSLGMFF